MHQQEGFEKSGYVPKNNQGQPDGNSGVTIGHGVDLGQMNKGDLDRLVKHYGLDPALAKKVEPYLGLKRNAADRYVTQNPITVTKAEAAQLSSVKYDQIIVDLARAFDAEMKRRGSPQTFAGLSPKLKTVAASVAVQHGAGLSVATPRFWGHLVNQDVPNIIRELRNFGPYHIKRRNREADYLAKP